MTMKMKRLKQLVLALAALFAVSAALGGCGGGAPASTATTAPPETTTPAASAAQQETTAPPATTEAQQETAAQQETTVPAAAAEGAPAGGEVAYPLENRPSLTYWVQLNTNVSAKHKSLNDTRFAEALIEQTGVQVEFIHPALGQEDEQFNLLIASGKMPDIVEGNWAQKYTGGAENAIANGLIVPLNDYLDSCAPDFKKYLDEYPQVNKMAMTDQGKYYGMMLLVLDSQMTTSYGPIIRADWLEDLNLEAPETIDEWTAALTAFKEQKNASAPLVLPSSDRFDNMFYSGAIIGAYEIGTQTYCHDGKVLYGPYQPQFKDFLVQMNSWYRDGLLDPSFTTNIDSERNAKMLNSDSGVTLGWGNATMDSLNRAFADIDPDARLIGINYPVLKKGETAMLGQKRFPVDMPTCAAVNAKSEHIEDAIKFLNYGYTYEGHMLNNFGIEGESYNMIDGYPTVASEILNPAEGSIGQAWSNFARAAYGSAYRQDPDYFTQYLGNPVVQDAISHWTQTRNLEHQLPPITVDVEAGKTYNKIAADLDTYVFEWAVRAITGDVSLDEFDTVFIPTLEGIGVKEALEIQQQAYDRYLAR